MTELGDILERLGLDQYLDALVGEGFDSWETVLDIQESDLDALNVKLGHRRKLQREIANYRGIPYERLVGSPAYEAASDVIKTGEGFQTATQQADKGPAPAGETKRKYRRHPKPDENAPERSPSAYVIFSNKIREEIKGENLSFTVIAKLVGDRWQKLDPSEKEPYEAQAAAAKERYNVQLSAYKKTDAYKEYLQYLAEFKAKHGTGASEGKKPRLDKESSSGSFSVRSGDTVDAPLSVSGHRRVGSIGSMGSTSYINPFPSPGGAPLAFNTAPLGATATRFPANSPHTESPPPLQVAPKLRTAISTQSSTSDDSWISRGEQSDQLQRTAQLSLVTGSAGYPATSGLSPFDPASDSDSLRQSSRRVYLPSPRDTLAPIKADATSPHQFGTSTGPSPQAMGSEEPWRTRFSEAGGRNLPDLSRTLHQPLTMAPVVPFGSAPLPPLMAQEDQPQRTLPPPRLASPRDQTRAVQSLARGGTTPLASSAATSTSSGAGQEGNAPRLDRSESDAINTLAELATTGGRSEDRRDQSQNPR